MKNRLLKATLLVTAGFSASIVSAAPFFQDSFESNSLKASSSGFIWGGTNGTGIGQQPHEGQYSLKFSYPAGADWAEQRFNLGGSYNDLWVKFWFKVPSNFTHGSMNNKLLALWMDDYSSKGDGPTVVWESWGNGSGGSNLGVHWSEGDYKAGGEHIQIKPFIAVPGDRGKWMEIVVHVKAATKRVSPIGISSYPYKSSDGVIQLWRRWDGQSTFEKLHEVTNANIAPPAAGPAGWHQGYFMGWANSAYTTNTEFNIDQVVMSTESLLSTSTTPPTPSTSSPPAAPILKVN